MRKLEYRDLELAAKRLRCDVAAIQAVIDVESGGNGFFPSGRPTILFEAHVFSKETGGAFDKSHPKLSSPHWNRALYMGGEREYDRLYQALQLNAEAALRSCSWGMFQIMGFNWVACGEASLYGFIMAMHNNEGAQLQLFCQFIISRGLDDELRRHDWAGFARGYNGPSYRVNKYDTKLAAAYRRHHAE